MSQNLRVISSIHLVPERFNIPTSFENWLLNFGVQRFSIQTNTNRYLIVLRLQGTGNKTLILILNTIYHRHNILTRCIILKYFSDMLLLEFTHILHIYPNSVHQSLLLFDRLFVSVLEVYQADSLLVVAYVFVLLAFWNGCLFTNFLEDCVWVWEGF